MTDYVFIDSGVGGIPYMTALLQKEPLSSCVYVADNANFPYGEKTHDQVVSCVVDVVQKICRKFEPGVIVLACNTISVNALETLRNKFPQIQFVGTVPAIKLAASVSQKKRIGLLATSSTCNNPYNQELKNQFANDCELIMRADSDLISFIEEKGFTADQAQLEQAVRPAVEFFRKNDCDVIILGCTHFLNLRDVFEKVALPEQIKIVDSVDGVVRQMIKVRGEQSGVPELVEGQEPQIEGQSLYITSNQEQSEQNKYESICSRLKINFCGKI